MADNELSVIDSGGTVRQLRSIDVGSARQVQPTFVWEGPEAPAVVTGAVIRYLVDASPAISLSPPTAGARYARLRVYETSGPASQSLRLYYRTDGVTPTADGANAAGFLLHGELIMVKLSTFANFKMIAEGAGVWEVYVEWLGNS